ncbi:MAG: hypothetical protein P4L51_04450 [Puia sp.]|nr:hypothetical protein [Puia sp.]
MSSAPKPENSVDHFPQFTHVIDVVSNIVYLFFPSTGKSHRLQISKREPLSGITSVSVGGETIYIFGGLSPSVVNSLSVKDLLSHIPRPLVPRAHLHFPRAVPTLIPYRSSIYAIGGFLNHGLSFEDLFCCERYDSSIDRWVTLPPLGKIRSNTAGRVMCGFVYVTGTAKEYDEVVVERMDTLDESAGWEAVICKNNAMARIQSGLCQTGEHELMLFGGGGNGNTGFKCYTINVGQSGAARMKERRIVTERYVGNTYFGEDQVIFMGRMYAIDKRNFVVYMCELETLTWKTTDLR